MKHVVAYLLAVGTLLLLLVSSSSAINVSDPHILSDIATEPIIVSAAPFGSGTAFLELSNRSDRAVNLSGYQITLIFGEADLATEETIILPDQYLVADGYMTLLEGSQEGYRDVSFSLSEAAFHQALTSIVLETPDGKQITQLENPAPTASRFTWLKRKSGTSGLGSKQSNFTQQEGVAQLNGMGLFVRPGPPVVHIVEILPRPITCDPFDVALTCRDYIKLYNPTNTSIALDDYVLRTDSSTSVNSNRFSLNVDMPPLSYTTIAYRDDLSPLSLTDSGGFVWIEDRALIAPYVETMVRYPSSLTATIGKSWAVDPSGVWSWTKPSPNSANVFDDVEQTEPQTPAVDGLADCGEGKFRNPETNRCKSISTGSTLKPCGSGQERNPATNRCRSISTTSASLVPCAPGQERNPATNRCRSIAGTASTLVPCKPGQQRNPETNRCRSTASTASVLKPCEPGQERNPETNRCRKVPGATLAAATGTLSNASYDDATTSSVPWYGLVGAIGVVVAGYGAWEWRSEIASATRRLRSLFGKA